MKSLLRKSAAIALAVALALSIVDFTALSPAQAQNVNQPILTPSTTGNPVEINATGTDTNVGIRLVPKGTGGVAVGSSGTLLPQIRVYVQQLAPNASTTHLSTTATGYWNARFIVTGISLADTVFIAGPRQSTANQVQTCPAVAAFPVGTNLLAITFGKSTGVNCTPPAGPYMILAVRT